jgi:hypothetical protein
MKGEDPAAAHSAAIARRPLKNLAAMFDGEAQFLGVDAVPAEHPLTVTRPNGLNSAFRPSASMRLGIKPAG